HGLPTHSRHAALPTSWRATKWGAPEWGWRMTTTAAPRASRVRAVSLRLSPFTTLEAEAVMLITSAPSPLAAISKDVRVRVLGSRSEEHTSELQSRENL